MAERDRVKQKEIINDNLSININREQKDLIVSLAKQNNMFYSQFCRVILKEVIKDKALLKKLLGKSKEKKKVRIYKNEN